MAVVRDSIHGNIELSDWAQELLDTPPLQRLRRIRQLGTAFLVYPGANHTRFEHALGAYRLAQEATRFLGLPAASARPVEAAALLHDVGHGPMSHLFESVLEEHGTRHEDFSVRAIKASPIGPILARHGIDAAEVAGLVKGDGRYGRIVSGDIDVDRMDYLVRDAHYTGVPTGADPERLLSAMEFRDGYFVLREEGLTAAEGLLVTRFLMYPSVYFHHTCRAAETMLVAGIRKLVSSGTSVEGLQAMDDVQLMEALRAAGGFAAQIAARIDERRLYKRAYEGTDQAVKESPVLASALADAGARKRLHAEIVETAGVSDDEVLLDAPRPPLLREVEARVLRRDGRIESLLEASTLVRTLMAAQRDHWRLWVFATPERVEAVAEATARVVAGPTKVKPKAAMKRHS